MILKIFKFSSNKLSINDEIIYLILQPPSNNNVIPVFRNAIKFGDRTALRDLQGDYTYRGLYLSSRQFCGDLSEFLKDGQQERIAFLMPNDARYVIVQWACWMSGQIGNLIVVI